MECNNSSNNMRLFFLMLHSFRFKHLKLKLETDCKRDEYQINKRLEGREYVNVNFVRLPTRKTTVEDADKFLDNITNELGFDTIEELEEVAGQTLDWNLASEINLHIMCKVWES